MRPDVNKPSSTSRHEKLLSREQLLSLQGTALETITNGVVITDAEGIILWVNPAFVALSGYSVEEVIGKTPRVLKSGKHDQKFYQNLWTTLLAGKTWRGSFTNRRKDGSLYYNEHTITPVRSKEGVITHFIAVMNDVTKRKEAEAAVKQSEGRLHLLLEQAADAIFLHDDHGKILDVNHRACESLGYSREELLKMSVTDFACISEEEVKSLWKQLQTVSSITVNDHHRRKDGTHFPVEVHVGSVTLDEQRLFMALARDITEREKAQLALTESQSRYRSLFENMLEGYAYCQILFEQNRVRDFIYLEVNDSFETLTGLKNVVGKRVSEVIPGIQETNPELLDLYGRVTLTGTPERCELYVQPLGIWFSISVYSHEKEHFIAVFENITERKQSEAQIAEQAALLEKTQDAIIVRDFEGKILFWNKGAERMYGWTNQEVVGRNVVEILHTTPKKIEKVNALTISHGEWNGEIRHLTKDQRELTAESRCTLIRDNEGRPKSVLSINTDITEKKKIEAQFMRAQRMESIGTLAGGIAHDLNNILSPIMMSIGILKTTTNDPQTTKILETIEVSTKRGADIVRQVLSFARGLEGERIEVQPKHLLKDVESIIKDTFPKDIRLRFSVPDDTWTIFGDPTQVHQILLNLCVNARDAMPNGGILSISAENCVLDEQYAAMNLQAKAGRYVNISVTDSGSGIPPGILDKIFEPFFTTKDPTKGTGLGLSTVMAIVKSHEGIINVYSEPGNGTTFKVYLPAMETSSEELKKQTQLVSPPRGNGETVLVVDDEASILTITSQTLEAFGYRVLTAENGADAVVIYADHRDEIAVALIDMMMPIMDGPATIHALLRINPAIKIVATSSLNTNDGVTKVSGASVKHFLTKPYAAGTLLKTLRAILDEA